MKKKKKKKKQKNSDSIKMKFLSQSMIISTGKTSPVEYDKSNE